MVSILLKVVQKDHLGWCVEFCPEFDTLSSQQKLDLIQDALYDLNVKYKDVNENY
jgi:hypothetical protein